MNPDEARTIEREITSEIQRYLKQYVEALWHNYRDGTPIDYDKLGFWCFPVMYVAGLADREGSLVKICGREEFDGWIRKLYHGFYDQGLGTRLDLEWSEVTVISSEFAVIETRGTRYRQDDTPFNTWGSCYWLRRIDGAWKQFGVCETDPPRPSVAEWTRWLRTFLT
jgi:hypothetical protein